MLDASVGPVRHANSLERHPLYDKQRCHESPFNSLSRISVAFAWSGMRKNGQIPIAIILDRDAAALAYREAFFLFVDEPPDEVRRLRSLARGMGERADKGEVSELDPGKSGSVTVALKAGKYLLICNVPGHFGAGMWTEFTVTN
jgi:hypothetical protein